jgi:hypothetical protein
MLAVALLRPETSSSRPLETACSVTGLLFAVVGAIGTLLLTIPAARQSRLLSGRDALARWHVGPGRWAEFLDLDAAINAEDPALANRLVVSKKPPADGIEVIVGQKAVLIDGSYHGLAGTELVGVGTWLGPPECIIFRYVFPVESGGPVDALLRFPTAADGDPVGRDVVVRYAAATDAMWHRVKPGIALRAPRRSRAIALAVTVLCAAASAWGYRALGRPDPSITAGLAAGIGTLLGMAAAVIALVTHLHLREP